MTHLQLVALALLAEDGPHNSGPDFGKGISLAEIGLHDGQMCVGQVGGEAVLLARRGDEVFAISATCTHYSGPLGDGILVDDTVRCPWHHACFSLRTGEALDNAAARSATGLDADSVRLLLQRFDVGGTIGVGPATIDRIGCDQRDGGVVLAVEVEHDVAEYLEVFADLAVAVDLVEAGQDGDDGAALGFAHLRQPAKKWRRRYPRSPG